MKQQILENQEMMGNKLADLLQKEITEQKAENKEMIAVEKKKEKRWLENFVLQTPYTQYFTINDNTITRSSGGEGSWGMVLIDMEVWEERFSFRTYIHKRQGHMYMGVTDRVTQEEKKSAQIKHTIQYACYYGSICYATDGKNYERYDDGIVVDGEMELLCEVEKDQCKVTFTVLKEGHTKYRKQVYSPMLRHPHYEFVPFFEMDRIGDRISWELQ